MGLHLVGSELDQAESMWGELSWGELAMARNQ